MSSHMSHVNSECLVLLEAACQGYTPHCNYIKVGAQPWAIIKLHNTHLCLIFVSTAYDIKLWLCTHIRLRVLLPGCLIKLMEKIFSHVCRH